MSYGHYGSSFAIPTMDAIIRNKVPLERIEMYVRGFQAYAASKPDITFIVTQIGCGLAGYTPAEIAPLFLGSPGNCTFDTAWHPFLGDAYSYWGHM